MHGDKNGNRMQVNHVMDKLHKQCHILIAHWLLESHEECKWCVAKSNQGCSYVLPRQGSTLQNKLKYTEGVCIDVLIWYWKHTCNKCNFFN